MSPHSVTSERILPRNTDPSPVTVLTSPSIGGYCRTMLTGVHIHLLVNHAPIFGSVFAFCLLIASYFAAADVFRRTAFVVLIITAIAGVIADKSGEPAEDAIRGFPGVRREVIHAHEDMATRAYILAGILGVGAVGALVRFRRKPVPRSVTHVMVAGTAFVAMGMIYTGLLGGRVRHTEVRPDAVKAEAMTIEPPRQRPATQPGR
jgi:uncharacterized membrane protein